MDETVEDGSFNAISVRPKSKSLVGLEDSEKLLTTQNNDFKSQFKKFHSIDSVCLDENKKQITLAPRRLSSSSINLSLPKSKYSHVPSKVKLYIQERKDEESRRKSMHEIELLEKRKLEDSANKDSLISPELDVFKNEFDDLQQKFKTWDDNKKLELFKSYFLHLKEERKQRAEDEMTINALQLQYNNSLIKYAAAENLIDDLRLYKYFYDERSLSRSSDVLNKFRKAQSASNIYSKCLYSPSSHFTASFPNLFKYTSSPLGESVPENSKSTEVVNESTQISEQIRRNSSSNTSEWTEKYKYLIEKMKEYVILEANSALSEDETNCVWKFIVNKYIELITLNRSSQDMRNVEAVVDLSRAIEVTMNKYWLGKSEDKMILKEKIRLALSSRGISLDLVYFEQHSKLDKSSILDSFKSKTTDTRSRLKEGDSGCPPSERSSSNIMRNWEQLDSLNVTPDRGSIGSCLNSQSCDSLLQCCLNHIPLNNKNESNRLRSYSKPEAKNHSIRSSPVSYIDDDEYDASGSSDQGVVYGEKNKKVVKKKRQKSPRRINLSRYEEKYLEPRSLKDREEFLMKSRKNSLDLEKIEKNLRHLNVKTKDCRKLHKIKSDKKSRRESGIGLVNVPLKALNDSFKISDTSAEYVVDSPLKYEYTKSQSPSRSCNSLDSKHINSKQRCLHHSHHSKHRKSPICEIDDIKYENQSVHDHFLPHIDSFRGLTSTPKNFRRHFDHPCNSSRSFPSNTEKICPDARSQSVPCLELSKDGLRQPYIHIEHFDCRENVVPEVFHRQYDERCRSSSELFPRRARKRYVYYGGKPRDIMSTLNETTVVAEMVRTHSEELLNALRADLKTSTRHRSPRKS